MIMTTNRARNTFAILRTVPTLTTNHLPRFVQGISKQSSPVSEYLKESTLVSYTEQRNPETKLRLSPNWRVIINCRQRTSGPSQRRPSPIGRSDQESPNTKTRAFPLTTLFHETEPKERHSSPYPNLFLWLTINY